MIRRGTVFVRHSAPDQDDGSRYAALFGIAEVDAGSVREDVVHGFATVSGAPFTLVGTGFTNDLADDPYDYTRIDSVDGILRAQIWAKPKAETGLRGGSMMFRRTRAPAAPGRETMIVVGAMTVDPGTYGDATLHDLAGCLPTMGDEGGWIQVTGSRPCPFPTNGSCPSQILQQPIWGWDGEPWGLFSTLRLDTQEICMEILRLRHGRDTVGLHDREAARLAELERHDAASIVTTRDREYDRFRREMIARHGHQRWDRVRTRADNDEESRIAGDIVRAMMREDDDAIADEVRTARAA